MTHRRAAHLALAASTSLTALVGCGAARATAPATPNAAVVAPIAQTTVAAARAERVPVLSRAELRVGTWAEAARLDVKQVFQFEGRPTIVLANVDETAATGSPRVVDGRGDASLVRALSEAKAADADLVGEVVTIFDQGALCHAEVVGLQVGAFAHFDDGRTRSARAIWDKASSYGALYLLGELRGGECLDGLTEAEAVVGAAEAVPLRIADAELRRATLPVLAALPAYHDAQASFDEYQREQGQPTEAWIAEDAILVQQIIVGRQRFVAASGSSGEGECGGWAESVSALWELGGPAAAPTLTEVELGADAYLGELTRVAVTADGLRFRSIHDGTTRVHYATDYDEGECGC